MRYAELFAGAGGLSLGLERAGMTAAWHAEWSDFPRRILKHHWPDVPLYGDVSELDGRELRALHGEIDLLSGGSPCQDLSVAGKRAGLTEGTRSSLFFQQMRLWEETGADLCLWENVAGALSSNRGKDFAAVISAFVGGAVAVPGDGWRRAGVACGSGGVAAWRILDAQYFGVPQRRRRVFILGTRSGRVDPAEVLSLSEGVRGDIATRSEAWKETPGGTRKGAAIPLLEVGKRTGVSTTDARAGAGIGEAGDPMFTLQASAQHGVVAFDSLNHTARAVCDTLRGEEGMTGGGWATVCPPSTRSRMVRMPQGSRPPLLAMGHDKSHMNGGGQLAVCTTGQVTHSLTSEGHDASEDGTGRGTPIVARCDTAGEGQRNDWETCTIVAGTLEAMEHGGGFPGTDGATSGHVVPSSGVPRRLMPIECERLMGWPDNWTNIPGASDAGRYKACGNGVVSHVAEWIGRRIVAAIESVEAAA